MDGVPTRIGFAVLAVVLLLLTVRCSLVRSHRPDAEPRDAGQQSSTQQPPADAAPPAPQPDAAAAPVPATTGAPAAAPQAPPSPAPRGESPPPPAAKSTPTPTAKRPAPPPRPAEPATGATSGARKGAAPVAKTPAPAAPLDLNGLKQELKATKAIGVFSKLTLKNQMDDLLSALGKFHQGKGKDTLADLHRSYELLVMKVLSLVQDDDTKLASDIVSSREAIWGILADPKKFAALQL
jgi:hypothetical protein